MTTFWWTVAAFIGGGCVGVFAMALMCMAGGLPKRSQDAPDLKAVFWQH